jgi:hypothetical protein
MRWAAVIGRVVDVIAALLVFWFHFAGRCALSALPSRSTEACQVNDYLVVS